MKLKMIIKLKNIYNTIFVNTSINTVKNAKLDAGTETMIRI